REENELPSVKPLQAVPSNFVDKVVQNALGPLPCQTQSPILTDKPPTIPDAVAFHPIRPAQSALRSTCRWSTRRFLFMPKMAQCCRDPLKSTPCFNRCQTRHVAKSTTAVTLS